MERGRAGERGGDAVRPLGRLEAVGRPWGKLFWIERRDGQYGMGDPGSRYSHNSDFEHLTFDIPPEGGDKRPDIARDLVKIAVVERHGGEFPRTRAEIEGLPGVGRVVCATSSW